MREVAIVGIGSTPFGRHAGTPIEQLGVRAAAEALLDAGIDRARIGAVYLGNFISGPLNGKEVLAGIVADQLGLPNVPCTKVEGACASGGIAFRHAWMAIASGQCDAALVVGVETMTHANTAQTTAALNCAMDNEHDGPSGLTFPGLFGLAWRIHAERHGTTRAQVSAVVRKNKRNGLLNPLAQMGADLSDDQIAASASIYDPLQLYDCCPTSDGAAALVLVAKPLAREATGIPVDVLATVQTRGASRIAGHPDLCSFDATVSAAQRAYAMAGVTRPTSTWSSCTTASRSPRSSTARTSASHRAARARSGPRKAAPQSAARWRSTPAAACSPRVTRWAPPASASSTKWCASCAAPTRTRSRAPRSA